MNAIENDVNELVFKELNNANEKFPLFTSEHQGYAVIKEEVEEVMDGMNLLLEVFAEGWKNTKQNKPASELFGVVGKLAKNVAIEAIQVAAMCDKYNMSLYQDGADSASQFADNDTLQPATSRW